MGSPVGLILERVKAYGAIDGSGVLPPHMLFNIGNSLEHRPLTRLMSKRVPLVKLASHSHCNMAIAIANAVTAVPPGWRCRRRHDGAILIAGNQVSRLEEFLGKQKQCHVHC